MTAASVSRDDLHQLGYTVHQHDDGTWAVLLDGIVQGDGNVCSEDEVWADLADTVQRGIDSDAADGGRLLRWRQ